MPSRRLDDHIRHLCARLAPTSEPNAMSSAETEKTLQDLLSAIHEKVGRLRNLAATKLLTKDPRKQVLLKERRDIRP